MLIVESVNEKLKLVRGPIGDFVKKNVSLDRKKIQAKMILK